MAVVVVRCGLCQLYTDKLVVRRFRIPSGLRGGIISLTGWDRVSMATSGLYRHAALANWCMSGRRGPSGTEALRELREFGKGINLKAYGAAT